MNIIRYMSFELNKTCNFAELHRGQCPISHPERYLYSSSHTPLRDEEVIEFWKWARSIGFRGIVMWHMYNEPMFVIRRIRRLMDEMKAVDPFQPFQMTTSTRPDVQGFEIVHYSDYTNGAQLDQRILTAEGAGKPYALMPKVGMCARGRGWEIPIDYYGNWCLCCNDWRCEESVGNIHDEPFHVLQGRWMEKRYTIRWNSEKEYNELPRMCRACLDKNPTLAKRGGI